MNMSYAHATGSIYVFFFNDTATTEIYTLSLHDALPIWRGVLRPRQRDEELVPFVHERARRGPRALEPDVHVRREIEEEDRKSTRLNSSHANISYAVFCLKKKIYAQYRALLNICLWRHAV